jgi:hypothetical protein
MSTLALLWKRCFFNKDDRLHGFECTIKQTSTASYIILFLKFIFPKQCNWLKLRSTYLLIHLFCRLPLLGPLVYLLPILPDDDFSRNASCALNWEFFFIIVLFMNIQSPFCIVVTVDIIMNVYLLLPLEGP